MNKNSGVLFYIMFISTVVINITSIISGLRNHETWLIVLGSASTALILIAGIINLVKSFRKKNAQVS